MAKKFAPSSAVEHIREQINHPIIDADGHFLQFMPAIREIIGEIADKKVVQRFERSRHPGSRTPVTVGTSGHLPSRSFWGWPSETMDRMTATLPELLYRRLDEVGIDFAILFPTPGPIATEPDDELRQAGIRAFNIYAAEAFADYRDRIAPVAIIPTYTPEEAISELEYSVGTLGLKAVRLEGTIPRKTRPDGTAAEWVDTLGHDSVYDYDPFWAKCQELRIVPAFHSVGYGWGSRVSTKNYVYNHIGSFSFAQEAVCRSLILGGVPKRFPGLRFAFLEGGVAWACELFAGLLGHYEKRNRDTIRNYDPARFDIELGMELFKEYARGRMAGHLKNFEASMRLVAEAPEPSSVDDFEDSLISSIEDIASIFADQLYFGCESDDPLNALAFGTAVLPDQPRLNAMFSSDIGHWDVPAISDVLVEAWELVDRDLLTPEEFRAFTFGNVASMITAVNPEFFNGTVVSDSLPIAQ